MVMEKITQLLKKMEARLNGRLARRSAESQANIRIFEERILAHLGESKGNSSVIPSAGGGNSIPVANLVIPIPSNDYGRRTRMVKIAGAQILRQD